MEGNTKKINVDLLSSDEILQMMEELEEEADDTEKDVDSQDFELGIVP